MFSFKKIIILFITATFTLLMLAGCGGPAKTEQVSVSPAQIETPIAEIKPSASEAEPSVPEAKPSVSPASNDTPQESSEPVTTPAASPSEDTSSALPDELPDNLDNAPDLAAYAAKLMLEYVKPNIFVAPVFSDEDEEAARKALRLIIAAYDKAIELYADNESDYYNRGSAYAVCYQDTGNEEYKEKALADFKKASDMGLTMAQAEYDKLAGQ